MWIRASLAYPLSFWIMTIGGGLITALDFVGLWLMFHTIDTLGGFSLTEIGLLYGATGLGIGIADLLIGSVERIGAHVRMGTLDTMMVRPVPLLVAGVRRPVPAAPGLPDRQALVVFAWAGWFVDWTPARVLVAVEMVVAGSAIFFCLFVIFSCVQFWTTDASEFANAFTYGGNTVTQYPLTRVPARAGEVADVRAARSPSSTGTPASTCSAGRTRSGCPSGSSSPRRCPLPCSCC